MHRCMTDFDKTIEGHRLSPSLGLVVTSVEISLDGRDCILCVGLRNVQFKHRLLIVQI